MPISTPDPFVRTRLKTRHLVLLVELGRHGMISQAAKASHMTQPAASKLLSELEQDVGAQLFERLPRGVRPTPCGQVMIRHAGAALAEMDAAFQEVLQMASGMAGTVSVGAILTPSRTLLPAAIALLKARLPDVHVTVTVDHSRPLVDGLRAALHDIVIGRVSGLEELDDIQFEPISDEPHAVIAAARHPLARQRAVTLSDLARQTWVVPPTGSALRDRLTSLFHAEGLTPPAVSVSTTDLSLLLNLVQTSDMLTALPRKLARPLVDAGELSMLPFELNLSMDVYGIITRRNHCLAPAASAMLSTLHELLTKIASPPPEKRDDLHALRDRS